MTPEGDAPETREALDLQAEGARLRETLRQALETDRAAGNLAEQEGFFKQLRTHPLAAVVADFCAWVLETLNQVENTYALMNATWEIERRRVPQILPRVVAAREHIPPKEGGFRDWRKDVDLAIDVLRDAEAGKPCNCDMYASGKYNVAPYDQPSLRITGEKVVERSDWANQRQIFVYCTRCERAWIVEEESFYHYPIFHWR